jgi:hypothetical protein
LVSPDHIVRRRTVTAPRPRRHDVATFSEVLLR